MFVRLLRALVARRLQIIAVWVVLAATGLFTYTSLIPRDGFPPVDVPLAVSAGNWLVDDTERVDSELVIPLERQLNRLEQVESLTTLARDDSFVAVLELKDGFNSSSAEGLLNFWTYASVPQGVEAGVFRIREGLLLDAYNLLIAIEGPADAQPDEYDRRTLALSTELRQFAELARADPFSLETTEPLPLPGQPSSGEPRTTGYSALITTAGVRTVSTIGVAGPPGDDVRDVTERVRALLQSSENLPDGWSATIALDVSETIDAQVNSLQWSVVFGMVVAAGITFLLISGRATLLTVLFVLTTVGLTCAALHALGISLNTVSLIGLILSVGLIVDDVIVITEAVDASDDADPVPAVERIATATTAGSLTTILVFAPMLFVTGVLGDFIRQLPLTVMVALTLSLILSLLLVPPLARRTISPGSERSTTTRKPVGALVARLPDLGRAGAIGAVALTVAFLAGSWFLIGPVGFDIFPPAKDGNDVRVDIEFDSGLTATEAQEIAFAVHERVAGELGDTLQLGYLHTGSRHAALAQYQLTSFRDRDPTAAELADRIEALTADTAGADVNASQISPGPPVEDWPFKAQIFAEDPHTSQSLATQIEAALTNQPIARSNGTTFRATATRVEFVDEVARDDGRRFIEVQARFDADDLSAVLEAARTHVVERVTDSDVAAAGLATEDLTFDFGQEDDNDEAFASTNIAFVVAIGVVYLLLALQFRSLLQPLLVLLALPFSLFGVFVGLWLTGNTLSFFVMLGLMGLVGIALNNSILLVDAANRQRGQGANRRAAMAHALATRFRPLVATTLTTIASLLPLALSDPFWESLAVTIIGGLISSTVLVLLALPFFWMALDRVRSGPDLANG